jgi:hypothetical protein
MTSNCEPLGRLKRIPVLTDPDPHVMQEKLKYTGMLLKKAEKEEAEKAKTVLEGVAKQARKEAKQKPAEGPVKETRKYQPRKIPEFKTLTEVAPKLFEELIERNKSDYMKVINKKYSPFIKRKLEKEVSGYVYDRTLAFNKTVEKIKYDEFINGARGNTGRIITKGIDYSRTSIYEGIKLAVKRKTFFIYQFKEGDYYWFFLNTSENQVLLEQIEAGQISEQKLFTLNEEKVKKLRQKKKAEKNLNTPHSENSEKKGFRNFTTPIQKLNAPGSDNVPQSTEKTGIPADPIITINNNYKKEKQHKKDKNVAGLSDNYFSEKEENYIKKLCNVKTPQGENIMFSLQQAREIVRLDLGRPIFDIIDEKIEMLFLEKNIKGSSWASILNNMIKQDRGGPEAYQEFKKTREARIVHEKYLALIRIFEPDARSENINKKRAVTFLQERIETLFEIAVKNKNLVVRDGLIAKLKDLEKACDVEKDLGFHPNDPASPLYQMIQELKKLN